MLLLKLPATARIMAALLPSHVKTFWDRPSATSLGRACLRRVCSIERKMKTLCRASLLVAFCGTGSSLMTQEASAQCSAQDVLQRHLSFRKAAPAVAPPKLIQPADAVPVWKTIKIGTVTNKYALLTALDGASCGVGDSVRNIFIRPELNVSVVSVTLDLVVVSVAELGITAERAPLAQIYFQARKFGFTLAPADTGPQLRLQYFDQPVGEFLNVGMDPIKMPNGEAHILVVANGGAGLLLLGQNVSANMQFFPSSQFVFVRPTIY